MAEFILLWCAVLVTFTVSIMAISLFVAITINVGRYIVAKLLGREDI
jgi:hypothetical protein